VKVRFAIPQFLRPLADGQAEVAISSTAATTVDDWLVALFSVHPGLADRVMTEQHQVRQHINVFVGDESIRFTGGLGTKVAEEGVLITILPAVSGGRG
jgi:molybdopterin converting factor small subunit